MGERGRYKSSNTLHQFGGGVIADRRAYHDVNWQRKPGPKDQLTRGKTRGLLHTRVNRHLNLRQQLTPLTRPNNFFMGRELKNAFGMMKMGEMNQNAHEEMLKIGIDFSDPTQAVGTMSGGQRQTLAIARAIYFGAKVLILDEPTSALGQKQQMGVLKTIKRVRKRGDIAIIFITHNEIHSQLVADRYTFLALGQVIGSGTKDTLEEREIRRLMAGGAQIADLAEELAAI
ncbi:MAG: ATP-binding cassette domain-containing protein [Myxococcota bacterium]